MQLSSVTEQQVRYHYQKPIPNQTIEHQSSSFIARYSIFFCKRFHFLFKVLKILVVQNILVTGFILSSRQKTGLLVFSLASRQVQPQQEYFVISFFQSCSAYKFYIEGASLFRSLKVSARARAYKIFLKRFRNPFHSPVVRPASDHQQLNSRYHHSCKQLPLFENTRDCHQARKIKNQTGQKKT